MSVYDTMTAEERTLRAKLAANTRWANADRAVESERARARQVRRYERLVDPDGTMDPDERAKRAANAMRAEMQRLALKSAKTRRRKREAS